MERMDRHELVEGLIRGKLTKEAAELLGTAWTASKTINEKEQNQIKTDIEIIKRTMATKSDLAELKMELKGNIAEVKAELKGDISQLKKDVEVMKQTMATKSDVERSKNDMLKWNAMFFVTVIALLIGIYFK